jgi:hypothetical protein
LAAPDATAAHSAMVTLARATGLVRWKALIGLSNGASEAFARVSPEGRRRTTWRPSPARIDLAEGRVIGEQLGAQLVQAVVRQLVAEHFRQGAQDRPVFLGLALREHGALPIWTRPSVFT